MSEACRAAVVFPGQGAHRPEMLEYAAGLPGWNGIREVLCEVTGIDPVGLVIAHGAAALNRNEISSLLTVAISAACLCRMRESGVTYTHTAGYSVGQYAALFAAGAIDLAALFTLVWERALLMNETRAASEGTMLAVMGLDDEVVEQICVDISQPGQPVTIANYNSPGQVTVAGTSAAIAAVEPRLQAAGAFRIVPLPVSGAWHCESLRAAVVPLSARLAAAEMNPPVLPVVDNTTGAWFPPDVSTIKVRLAHHVAMPVRWRQGIELLISAGVSRFIEVGYGNMLTRFGFFIDRSVEHVAWDRAA